MPLTYCLKTPTRNVFVPRQDDPEESESLPLCPEHYAVHLARPLKWELLHGPEEPFEAVLVDRLKQLIREWQGRETR